MGKPAKWLRFLGVKKGLKSQKPSKDAHSQKDEETSVVGSASPVGSNQGAVERASSKEEAAGFSALPPAAAQQQQQSIVFLDGGITTGNAAAIKLQTAFRSFLVTKGVMVDDFVQARRALRALRGLVRLQALVRGHAVRKQGAVSLRTVLAVVKVQAVARGRHIRRSSEGQSVQERVLQNRQSLKDSLEPPEPAHGHNIPCRPVATKPTKAEAGTLSQKLAAYATQQKPAPSVSKPDWKWLELWTAAAPWEPAPPKQEVKAGPTKEHSLQNGDSGNETGSPAAGKVPRSKSDRLHSSKVPSYMATTQSAKAKLRSLSSSPSTAAKESPEKVASPAEKRRFSLPGSNGKFQDPITHPRRLSFPVKAR